MGVRRAVELALDALNKYDHPIYTYGPLIHNPQVLDLLEERGISVINDIPENGSGTILIRTHGVPPATKEKLKTAGFNVVDTTCPRVIKVQTIIDKHARQGYASIIIGDKEHPEVIGLLGFSHGKGVVAGTIKDLNALEHFNKAIIVAQTTQNKLFFEDVKKWAAQNFPHYKIFDTICDSAENRQAEIRQLANMVDAVVVVGGHNSGNTRRLANIVKLAGKPVFHIESESELDAVALSKARRIGLTAGASTPNWIIKRVYNTLETLSVSKVKNLRTILFNIQRPLLLTNIYVAIGSGCLCYAASNLQGITHFFSTILIAMFYILTMHVINNLTGSQADRYNDPDRAAFYKTYKTSLSILAITGGVMYLITAYTLGIIPFLIILAMSIMGLSYNLRWVPKPLSLGKYFRIRDIPGSKTVLIAIAWGIITSVFPIITVLGEIHLTTVLAFLWTTSLVFVRTAFSDILDMQGDRIVGKETIPILVGEAKTMRILKYTLIFIIALFFTASVFQLISSLGFFLLICPMLMLTVLIIHERGYMLPGIRLEFLIESHFVLSGFLTYLWSAF